MIKTRFYIKTKTQISYIKTFILIPRLYFFVLEKWRWKIKIITEASSRNVKETKNMKTCKPSFMSNTNSQQDEDETRREKIV